MHYLDDTLVFSPSDLIIFMASPFASWMERLTLEQPDHGIESDCHDPLLQTLANRGMQHERAYLDHLNAQGLDMVVIDDSDPQGADATWDAMQAGADVIYLARLSVNVKVAKTAICPNGSTSFRIKGGHSQLWFRLPSGRPGSTSSDIRDILDRDI